MFIEFFSFLHRTPPAIGTFKEDGADVADDDEMSADSASGQDDDLSPVVGAAFGIEYVSASGEKTLRRISVSKVEGVDGEVSQLFAFCYLRNAYRRFRLDRITAVYDDDGVFSDPREFFAHYDLAVKSRPKASRKAATGPTQTPALRNETADRLIRREWRHEIRALTAMARVDGRLAERECDIILDYASAEAERCDIIPDGGDVERLAGYLRRLHPTAETVSASLDEMRAKSTSRRERFLRAAGQVMNADGIQDGREFDFLMQLRAALSADR